MTRIARRRWLLGAAALPGALALAGCSDLRIPFLGGMSGGAPGRCVDPGEEIPEEDLQTIADGVMVDMDPPDEDVRFEPSTLAISPDGTILAAAESYDRVALEAEESRGIILWDAASGEVLRRISSPALGQIAWDPDGSRLAIGEGRRIDLVDLEGTHQRTLLGHELPKGGIAYIGGLSYSPDGSMLASTGADGTVRLWDMDPESCGEGQLLRPPEDSNGDVSWSPDGSTLAIGGFRQHNSESPDNPPELWDPATGERKEVLEEIDGEVFALSYSPEGDLVVVTDKPSALLVLSQDGSLREGPVIESTWFVDLAVGPGGVIALHRDDELLRWNPRTGEELRDELAERTDSMVWSADGTVLYCLSAREGVLALDGADMRTFALP